MKHQKQQMLDMMLLLFLITLRTLTMQNINKLIYELLSDRTLSQNALHLYVSPKNVQQMHYILMKVQQNHMIYHSEHHVCMYSASRRCHKSKSNV